MGDNKLDDSGVVLGFGPIPGKTYVFVGTGDMEDNSTWYTLNYQKNEKSLIMDPALTGYLSDIRIVPKLFKDKVNYKLDIHIKADQDYVIRAGLDTTFSSGIVHHLTCVEDFFEPITIIAKKGTQPKIVFGNIMNPITKAQYFFEGERKDKLSGLVFEIQERLGVEIQSKESILEDVQKANTNSNTQNQKSEKSSKTEFSGPDDDDEPAF